MAKQERAENLEDVLKGKPYPPAGLSAPPRGGGVTADNSRGQKLPDTTDFESGKGRHRR